MTANEKFLAQQQRYQPVTLPQEFSDKEIARDRRLSDAASMRHTAIATDCASTMRVFTQPRPLSDKQEISTFPPINANKR